MEKFTKNNRVADNKKGTMMTLTESLTYLKDILFDDIHKVADTPVGDVDTREVWAYGGRMANVPFANTEFWTVNRFATRDMNTHAFTGATLNIIVLINGIPSYNVTAKYDSVTRKAQIGIVAIDEVRGPIGRTRYKENVIFD